jgi:hypothetical protein
MHTTFNDRSRVRWIHVVTAAVYLMAMVGIAYGSDRSVVYGLIQYSWVALTASMLPFVWSVALMACGGGGRVFPWISLVVSLVVVAIGARFSSDAINSVFDAVPR